MAFIFIHNPLPDFYLYSYSWQKGILEIFINRRFQDSEKFSKLFPIFPRASEGGTKVITNISVSPLRRQATIRRRWIKVRSWTKLSKDGKVRPRVPRPRIPKKKVPKDFILPALFKETD